MKTILLILLASLALSGCMQNTNQITAINTDSIYAQAKDLKGLSDFIIGKTKTADIRKLNIKIDKDTRYYLGAFRLDEKDNCPLIQTYYINEYYIGDSKIGELSLHFYRDTLYEIYVGYPDDIIKEAFLKKYGKGFNFSFYNQTGAKSFTDNTDITWKNASIEAKYVNYFESSKGKVVKSYRFFKINSTTGIEKRALDCSNEAYHLKQVAKEKEKQLLLDKF